MIKYIIILLFAFNVNAQNEKSISIYQDFKMAIYENNHNLTAPTLNTVIKMNVIDGNFGIGISYERANLYKSPLNRYTLDVWNFRFKLNNKLFLEPIFSFGFINRFNKNTLTYGTELKTLYKISNRFKIGLLSTYVLRSDIDRFRFNNYVGIEYRIK